MHSTVFTFGFFLCYTLGTRVLFDCICILLNDSSLLYPSYILSLSLSYPHAQPNLFVVFVKGMLRDFFC